MVVERTIICPHCELIIPSEILVNNNYHCPSCNRKFSTGKYYAVSEKELLDLLASYMERRVDAINNLSDLPKCFKTPDRIKQEFFEEYNITYDPSNESKWEKDYYDFAREAILSGRYQEIKENDN